MGKAAGKARINLYSSPLSVKHSSMLSPFLTGAFSIAALGCSSALKEPRSRWQIYARAARQWWTEFVKVILVP